MRREGKILRLLKERRRREAIKALKRGVDEKG